MSLGIYLFCLTPGNPLPEIDGLGIDGEHRLHAEGIGGVAAVVSEVTLEDFSGPESRQRLEDLAWIGPRALRHEEVIMMVMRESLVLPVRFGTVFSSTKALAEPLNLHQDALARFFRETVGTKEWSIRAYADMRHVRSHIIETHLAAEKGQLAGLSPGKRYFLAQKIKAGADREATSWLKGIGADIVRIVQKVSSAFSERRLLSRNVTGIDDEMFFHGAFLVPDRSVDALQSAADEWNRLHEDQGLWIEISGPWPPYHFVPNLETQ